MAQRNGTGTFDPRTGTGAFDPEPADDSSTIRIPIERHEIIGEIVVSPFGTGEPVIVAGLAQIASYMDTNVGDMTLAFSTFGVEPYTVTVTREKHVS